jgi:hypothetical protein
MDGKTWSTGTREHWAALRGVDGGVYLYPQGKKLRKPFQGKTGPGYIQHVCT